MPAGGSGEGSPGGRSVVARAERALHQHDVDPAPELEAGRFERSRHAEAEVGVQPDRGLVAAVADHGDDLAEAALLARLEQRRKQHTADALTLEPRTHVDRVFDRVAI